MSDPVHPHDFAEQIARWAPHQTHDVALKMAALELAEAAARVWRGVYETFDPTDTRAGLRSGYAAMGQIANALEIDFSSWWSGPNNDDALIELPPELMNYAGQIAGVARRGQNCSGKQDEINTIAVKVIAAMNQIAWLTGTNDEALMTEYLLEEN